MGEFSDFRSDTVTHPTEKMRKAMAEAIVGDDVLGDDPTVLKLEELAAEIAGKEAGLFCPTGTMANSIAVKGWTQELQEAIVEARSHIYNMESTHMTFISRVTPRPISSDRGAMPPEVVEQNIKKASVHIPQTSLICIENSHNNWSGAVVPMENLKALREIADRHDLKIHFDGARVFNACSASGVSIKDYAAIGDSIMFCLSKGLSAPVGSILLGPKDFIDYGRRIRKALGGGMRQVGVLAAPGIVALTEMRDRLHEDNTRAKRLAEIIAEFPGIMLDPVKIETNIIIFGFDHPKFSIPEFLIRLREEKVLALATTGGIRFVCHKDVNDEDVERAYKVFRKLLN
ncbi:MAG: aminotransferase class I/II-fold pyridoxal phosphate-dependent enzyme [Candidatus Aminicenantes bacterium]|nr:aminotransferase class I/II-fold pyridoxal phosphate-dependent enzyme [Candidatus Aminicenantes bacterium]